MSPFSSPNFLSIFLQFTLPTYHILFFHSFFFRNIFSFSFPPVTVSSAALLCSLCLLFFLSLHGSRPFVRSVSIPPDRTNRPLVSHGRCPNGRKKLVLIFQGPSQGCPFLNCSIHARPPLRALLFHARMSDVGHFRNVPLGGNENFI